jgi:hypothetical protein
MKPISRTGLIFCLAMLASAPVLAAPANSLRELYAQFSVCFKDIEGEPGEEVTITFSLKRDGSLLGKAHISYSRLPDDPAERARFIDNLAATFDRCLPARITDGLGGAIAGRRIFYRFTFTRPEIRG